ncbi:S8 family peptidase [Gracilibacillus caseinilyticus]|uniref:S8 family peptidase n=1 Tax=Gracilibacillus caseinilyticus TaxID=2932256 RepID=A0ABY4EYD5_9BACI|nr:S8 family peptidase [Gracilibacillus caseinilyticus]UOQ49416.1 S8 family peptidase [Gracilibacillus caseinilyticus]
MSDVVIQPIKIAEAPSTNEKIPSNIQKIGVITKWKQGYTGKNVVVAVLDTGCDTSHIDLKERIIDGRNFTQDTNSDPDDYEDLNGHGTHVIGTLAGSLNDEGIVGVAPEVDVLVVKVLDEHGSGSIQTLIEGMRYAMSWRGLNNERVSAISLSLGVREKSRGLQQVVHEARSKGIFVIAAAGNDGDGDIETIEYRCPACYVTPIVVGALNKENEIAVFSNTNRFIDLYAPGVTIYSSYINDEYTALSGTSMATPHVAGAIAILVQEFRETHDREPFYEEILECLFHSSKAIDREATIRMLDFA